MSRAYLYAANARADKDDYALVAEYLRWACNLLPYGLLESIVKAAMDEAGHLRDEKADDE